MARRNSLVGYMGVYVGAVLTCGVMFAAPHQSGQTAAPPPVQGRAGEPGRGTAAPAPPTLAAIERAAGVLADARKALGGQALDAVKTLSASGRTRRVRGNNLVPIEFELGIELPDKYYRKDEFPAEETDPTSLGFNGDDLVQTPPPAAPPARAGGPPPPTPEQLAAQRKTRVNTVKQDFARFALGMFASSFDAYPLGFAYSAQAEAPQGKADVLDVTGPNGFKVRFLVLTDTHLPVMVSWQLPPTSVIPRMPGQPPPPTVAPGAVFVDVPAPPAASATQEEKEAYAKNVQALQAKARATPVEHRIYFADYRDVNGVKLPFRLRRAIGTDTTEETTFDRYQINGKIDPRRFQIVK